MCLHPRMAPTRAADPQGNEWEVRRRWAPRRLRWRGRGSLDALDGADLASQGADLPVIGMVLVAVAIVLFAVAAVLFVVPLVIFLVELVLVVTLVGLGLVGRVLLGHPWTVEARRLDTGDAYEWKVSGWTESRELVAAVAAELRATGHPTDGTPVHDPP